MKLSYIPNLLCIFRIFLVLPMLWLLADERYAPALAVFALAGFTDGLDGFLAKRCGWHTELGALLDPAADKLLLVSAFVSLGVLGLVPGWLVVLVLARDVVIVSGALAYRMLIGPFRGQASPASKLNTVMQLAFVLAVIAHAAYALPAESLVVVLGATVVATTLVSGSHYVWTWGRRAWLGKHGEAV